MILDFHTHIYPPELAKRVISNMKSLNVKGYCDATADAIRSSMAMAGITHSVILNIAVKVGQSEKLISFAQEILQSGDTHEQKLISFASVHPFETNWKELLQKVADLGFKGIKLHPNFQDFDIDDYRLEPFYKEAARLGLITILHSGHDDSMPKAGHATAERIRNILPVLEEGKTVLAHMGGYKIEKEVLEYICGSNVYFDTSFNLTTMDETTAREIFKKHQPEKFLFGTDSPWCDQKQYLNCFLGVVKGYFSEKDINKILWENGAELLEIL